MANSEFIDAALLEIADELKSGFVDEISSSGKAMGRNGAGNPDNFIVNIENGVLTITSKLPYMGALEFGRGPSQNGRPNGREVYNALQGWLRAKNLQLYKYTGGGARQAVSTTDSYIRKTAFIMARKIHEQGWEGIGFAAKTVDRLSDSIQRRLGDAYARQLEQIINNRK